MNLAYERTGAGADALLVHGWGLNRRVWGEFAAGLVDMRVTRVDLPGHGHSSPVTHGTWEAIADALAARCPRPAVVIGWSLGALAAMALASRHPDRVTALVLFGATPRFVQGPDWDCAVPAALLRQFGNDLAHDPRRTLSRFLSLQLGEAAHERGLHKRLRALAADAASVGGLQAGLKLLADTDLRPLLPTIAAPTLVIHGQHDRLTPPAAGRYLAHRLSQARFYEVPAAGHAPFLSHTSLCLSSVRDFLHERIAQSCRGAG